MYGIELSGGGGVEWVSEARRGCGNGIGFSCGDRPFWVAPSLMEVDEAAPEENLDVNPLIHEFLRPVEGVGSGAEAGDFCIDPFPCTDGDDFSEL